MREKRIKSALASLQYQDHREKVARQQAETIKKTGPQANALEEHLRSLYYSALRTYKQDSGLTYATALTGRSLSLWQRVRKMQESSGVSPEDYIKAQFAWFKEHFGTWPKISHLATENAVKRAQEFEGLQGNVVASAIEHKTDLADTFRTAEKYIRTICKQQKLTKEELYRQLVIPGIITLPKEYLKRDPVFQKVLDEQD